MVGNLIVALIVLAAAVHAATRYLPASWRQQIVYALTRRGAGLARMARWFNTESSCGGGCASCKSCATPEPAAPAPGTRRVIKIHARD